ncbi:MAG: 3-methylitaconate isomerase [Oscillospiraceae bacterium]|nr:3-methylitaconate isomerase [Oscillospiraceae bacterium]MBR6207856.1 3-methylitaconate isomerase [Oscillospiraceae bacterium]
MKIQDLREQESFRCTYMRGGTSKAVFFKKSDLPTDEKLRDEIIMAVFGTDVRQIDGLGGADITTSKVAIIGPPTRPDADVDYNFGQVQMGQHKIVWTSNCGNISSAVAPFAIDEGMVKNITEPITEVRIHNTNTQKVLISRVHVKDGRMQYCGDFHLDGVPGTASKIELDYKLTYGATTGKLLPTGNVVDELDVPDFGKIQVSLVDIANPVCFITAESVGLRGDESKPELAALKDKLELMERIRAQAAVKMGYVDRAEDALEKATTRPMLSIVSPARDYADYASGKPILAKDLDFLARVLWNQEPVDTYTGTGTICTCVAARIEGTLVNQVCGPEPEKTGLVRFGHGRGINSVAVTVSRDADGGFVVDKAVFNRTARRILDGIVYVKKEVINAAMGEE